MKWPAWGRRWMLLLVLMLMTVSARSLLFQADALQPDTPDAAPQRRDSPFLIADALPAYPATLIAPAGGTASVEITINGGGVVTSARVVDTTLPEANECLLTAAKQYRFEMPMSLRQTGATMGLLFQIPPLVGGTRTRERSADAVR